jgi:hypothetical protein
MSDRDAELQEEYLREYDREHGARLITAHRQVSAATLLADITRQRATASDRINAAMHRESELGVFDLEAVLEAGRHTI